MFLRKVIEGLFLLFRAAMEAFSFVLNCRSETKCCDLAQTRVVVVKSQFRRNVLNKARNPSRTRNVATFKRCSFVVHHFLSLSQKSQQHLIDQLPLQVRRDFRSLALIPVWSGLEWFGVEAVLACGPCLPFFS